MPRKTTLRRVAAAVVLMAGCGPTRTTASGEGSGSDTSTPTTSSTTAASAEETSAAAASNTGESSTGIDLECPDENVFEGNLELRTGDDPMSLYGLTEITGRLTISSDDIIDLSFLTCLRAVDQLIVNENSNLVSFEGLERLTQVLTIVVFDNPELESLRGLDALREVGGLTVYRNPSMTTIGLDDLEHAVGIRIGAGCGSFAATRYRRSFDHLILRRWRLRTGRGSGIFALA